MNVIDLTVVEVLSEPVCKYGKWFVAVTAEAYGRASEHEVMFDSYEEARVVGPGYVFSG